MKTAIALITAALTATSAQAWGEREQGALAGIIGTIVLQQIYKDSERNERQDRPVIIREYRIGIEPQIWPGAPRPPLIIFEQSPIVCPQGLAAFYLVRYDRHGRPFYFFDGCR